MTVPAADVGRLRPHVGGDETADGLRYFVETADELGSKPLSEEHVRLSTTR